MYDLFLISDNTIIKVRMFYYNFRTNWQHQNIHLKGTKCLRDIHFLIQQPEYYLKNIKQIVAMKKDVII